MEIEPTISHSHRAPTSEQNSLLALAREQGSISSDSLSGGQDQSYINAVPAVPAARTRDARSAAPPPTSPRNPPGKAQHAQHPSLMRGLIA